MEREKPYEINLNNTDKHTEKNQPSPVEKLHGKMKKQILDHARTEGEVASDKVKGEVRKKTGKALSQKNSVGDNISLQQNKHVLTHLKHYLAVWSDNFYPHQRKTFEKVIQHIAKGGTEGLIKIPTGGGKTKLFCDLLLAAGEPGMILVPRRSLLGQTKDALLQHGFLEKDITVVDTQASGSTTNEILMEYMSRPRSQSSQVVMTYQSLLALQRTSSELLDRFLSQISMAINDEGHRALGRKTATLMKQLLQIEYVEQQVENGEAEHAPTSLVPSTDVIDEEDVEVVGEEEEKEEVDTLEVDHILQQKKKLHFSFTATPKLLGKSIQDVYGVEAIEWVKTQELVENDFLILPRLVQPGIAEAKLDGDSSCTSKLLRELGEQEKFVMRNGKSVAEATLESYLTEKKRAGGYLPGVVFCPTIAYAEKYTQLLASRRIRSVRVTSGNDSYARGTSPEEAKTLLESNQIDLVVSVGQVGEGWDIPTLRAMIQTYPITSGAKYIQGMGRIMRSLKGEDIQKYPMKSAENTVIIEPRWQVYRDGRGGERVPVTHGGAHSSSVPETQRRGNVVTETLYEGTNCYDWLILHEEYDYGALKGHLNKWHMNMELKNAVLTPGYWKEYFQKIMTAESWRAMKLGEKGTIFTSQHGTGAYALARIFGIEGNPVGNLPVWYELGQKLWPESTAFDRINEKTEKEWQEYFQDNMTAEQWRDMKHSEKGKDFTEEHGIGVHALARIFGIEGNPVVFLQVWYELGQKLWSESTAFEKVAEKIMEQWQTYIQGKMSAERWRDMKRSEKGKNFTEEHGIGVYALASIFGIKGDPIGYQQVWYELGQKLWPESAIFEQIKEKTREDWQTYFQGKMTAEQWKDMKPSEKGKNFTEEHDMGVYALAGMFGIKGDPIGYQQVWYELGQALWPESTAFDRANEKTKEDWQTYFQDKMSAERWRDMKRSEKGKNFTEEHDIGVNALARIFGIEGNPVVFLQVWYELGKKIWSESAIFEQVKEKTKEDWQTYFQDKMSAEQWRDMKQSGKGKNFTEEHDIGVYALASIVGIEGDPVGHPQIWYELGQALWPESTAFDRVKEKTKEEWQKYFQDKMSAEQWRDMKQSGKGKNFTEEHDIGAYALARIFVIEGNLVSNMRAWYELGQKLWPESTAFDRANEKTKEDWQTYFQGEMTAEQWRDMKRSEKGKNFTEENEIGPIALARIFGMEGDPVSKIQLWYELGQKLWPESTAFDMVKVKTKEEWQKYFQDEMTAEKWRDMKQREKNKNFTEVHGIGPNTLARIFAIEGNPRGYLKVWYELGQKIWPDSTIFDTKK